MGRQLTIAARRAGLVPAAVAASWFVLLWCSAPFALEASAVQPEELQTVPDQAPADGAEETAEGPHYKLRTCCKLCPKAADPHAYDGAAYLDDFRVLIDGQDGWLFRSTLDLTTNISIAPEALAELKRLVAALRKRGTELVVIFQPPRALMDPHRLTPEQRKKYDLAAAKRSYAQALESFRSAGVTVPPLDRLVDENKGYDYFLRRDHHWTSEGARRTAQVVAQTVQAMPAFAGIPRQEFVTRASGVVGKPGTLQKVAQQICGGQYSMQYYTTYVTEPAGGGSGGNDAAGGTSSQALLGDSGGQASGASAQALLGDGGGQSQGGGDLLGDSDGGAPQITLTGSSNSDSIGTYNFSGYLKEALKADLLNTALTGGGYEGALLRYLPSAAFQKHPPKILIWEMPWWSWPRDDGNPYRTFNPYRTVRQAVPLVNNGCRGRPALLQRTTALHRGSNEILFNGGGMVQPLVGARHWLDFQFDDPGVQQLHAVIWYLNGQKESMKLRFKEYVNNEGRFVAELRNNRPDYAGATFMGATIELEQEPAKPLTVEAQVCQAIDPPALPRQVKTAASAQSSPEDSPKKTSPKRSSRRSGNVQN